MQPITKIYLTCRDVPDNTIVKIPPFNEESVRKRRGKKEPPLRTVDEGLYWAVALGQNSQGRVSEETKGVCEV